MNTRLRQGLNGGKEDIFRKLSVICLLLFLCVYLMFAMFLESGPHGESTSMILSTVSLMDHGDYQITEEDVEKACELFPTHAEIIRAYTSGAFPVISTGNMVPYYFSAYSLLCIPVLLLLQLLGMQPIYAFSISNALMLSLSLWVIYKYARIDHKLCLLAIVFLGVSPVIRYIEWQSYEVALCAFLTVSVVLFYNGNRKLSAFFLSVAGTMNITVMALGIFMVADYFLDMFRGAKGIGSIMRLFVLNWKKTFCYALCFVPCLLPLLYSYILFGLWSPLKLALNISSSTVEMGGRMVSYLFSLDMGLLPYISFAMVLFAIMPIYAIMRKNARYLCTFLGVISVIAAYSLNGYMNCGMTGIARYNAWIIPAIVLSAIYFVNGLTNKGGYWSGLACLLVSACLCFVNVDVNYRLSPWGDPYSWSPLSKAVFDYIPQAYNPLPSTFNARTSHIDGGYSISGPVVYMNDEGYVKKVLSACDTAEDVEDLLLMDEKGLDAFRKELSKVSSGSSEYMYFNFGYGTTVKLRSKTFTADELPFVGNAEKNDGKIVLHSGGGQYGPYAPLAKGSYRVTVYGENLSECEFGVQYEKGAKPVDVFSIERADDRISYEFQLSECAKDIECVLFNYTAEDASLGYMVIEAMGD